MFDKVKAIGKLKKMQSEIQKELEQIYIKKEKGNMEVVVRGDRKIEKIVINGEEDKRLKDFLNDALKDADKKAAKKAGDPMMEMLGIK